TTSPIPTPPTTLQRNRRPRSVVENVPTTTAPIATFRSTSAVPSFTRLSPSITAITRRGTPSRLAIDVAAIGSVGETTAPSTNAAFHENPPIHQCAAAATVRVVTATRPTASRLIGAAFWRRSRRDVKNADR